MPGQYTTYMENVQFVRSKLLTEVGLTHGWCMRYGGVSSGLFESLNGKKGSGDLDENVDENRKRALAALCHPERSAAQSKDLVSRSDRILRPQKRLLGARQAQDDKTAHIIHEFKTNILQAGKAGEFPGYDASVTTKKEVVLSQTTADCGSIIIASSDGKVVALVHGSWHTLRDKIICDVVAKMKTHTSRELVAGIGPMICVDCYEFGDEATTLFDKKYVRKSGQKYHVNLKQMILDQLKVSGISKIDDLNICTKQDDRFFSHRRSGAQSGRFLTLAALPS